LFGESYGIVQYHPSGTEEQALKLSPLNILINHARQWATQRTCDVEGLYHVAERRQHLRGVVDEVVQLALVNRIGTRAEPQVVQLHVAAAAGEFDRVEPGTSVNPVPDVGAHPQLVRPDHPRRR
jgi:hypothetical protein